MSSAMDWPLMSDILKCVALGLGALVLLALFAALRSLSKFLKRSTTVVDEADKTISELRTTVLPILDKVDVTVDAVNAELLRVDNILSGIETASQKVTQTSETVSGIVATPVDFVAGFTDKLRRGWKTRRAEVEDRQ